jgi:thioesterase domain-containing protein/acyl carrier protein
VESLTEIERTLVDIWKKVLGIDKVEVNDRFAELGGDSLRAAHAIILIKRRLGVDVTVTEFYFAHTVAELAHFIQEKSANVEKPSFLHLVPMQPGGSKRPLFLISGADGDPYTYIHLVEALGCERPIYAFQAGRLDGVKMTGFNLNEMVEEYIKEMRMVQPEGPYSLVGFSAGGIVSYETAQQLVASGDSVAMLGIIDIEAPIPKTYKERWSLRRRFFREVMFYGLDLFTDNESKKAKVDLKLLPRLMLIARLGLEAVGAGRPSDDPVLPGSTLALPKERQEIWFELMRVVSKYVPKQYPGRVTLFKPPRFPMISSPSPTMGWDKLAIGGVDVVEVPGILHGSQLKPPYVATFAKVLNIKLG